MDTAEVVAHIQTRGKEIFGIPISLSRCGNLYATIVSGRLYTWDEFGEGFNLLISVPKADGTIDLVTMPDLITEKGNLQPIFTQSDREFRDWCSYPSGVSHRGLEAEDLFLEACVALGFMYVSDKIPAARYTVRRGSYLEDMVDKIDFVLTFPDTRDHESVLEVPLQITLSHRTGTSRKRELAHQGMIAYLPLDKFVGSNKEAMRLLSDAVAGIAPRLWLFGEMIRIVAQRYLSVAVKLPNERPLQPKYIHRVSFDVLRPRLSEAVSSDIEDFLTTESFETHKEMYRAIAERLIDHLRRESTIYALDNSRVIAKGW